MGLFTKKEDKSYLVFDIYTGDIVASCVTKEVKQILQVQPKAQFVECNSYEFFKYKEHGQVPLDIENRPKLTGKEVK